MNKQFKLPINLFETMCLIRRFEDSLMELYDKGLISGTIHTSSGQEACAVGVCSHLDPERDIVYSNHRCHGHFLSFTGNFEGLLREIIGLPDGICCGKGGSQHIHARNFYSNGILGAGAPVAVGIAEAEKRKDSGALVVLFMGDGTFGEGVIYEAFNLASLRNVPILFAVEHNHYAQSTPTRHQLAGSFDLRAKAFNIPYTETDGSFIDMTYDAASEAILAVRSTQSPRMLLMETHRFNPHSKGDDTRDPEEIALVRQQDPIGDSHTSHLWNDEQKMEARKRADDAINSLIQKVTRDL